MTILSDESPTEYEQDAVKLYKVPHSCWPLQPPGLYLQSGAYQLAPDYHLDGAASDLASKCDNDPHYRIDSLVGNNLELGPSLTNHKP